MFKRKLIIIPFDASEEIYEETIKETENHLVAFENYCLKNNIEVDNFYEFCSMGYIIIAYIGFTNVHAIYTPTTISEFQNNYLRRYIYNWYKKVAYSEYQLCFIDENAKEDFRGSFIMETDLKNELHNIAIEKTIYKEKKMKYGGLKNGKNI